MAQSVLLRMNEGVSAGYKQLVCLAFLFTPAQYSIGIRMDCRIVGILYSSKAEKIYLFNVNTLSS